MKIFLVVASCVAWMTLASANEICIQDVKVITPQGLYEEIKKQETENGHIVSTQTLEIKKPNIDKIKEKTERQIKSEDQLEARKHLINKYLKHLRISKMLHSLLSSMDVFEPPHFYQPKPQPVHHNHHRVIIIRMLPSNPFAIPFPMLSPLNKTDNKYSYADNKYSSADDKYSSADDKYSSADDKYSSARRIYVPAYQPETPADQTLTPISITTPKPSIQDQIPPPEVINNEITE